MLLPRQTLTAEQRRLLKLYSELGEQDRLALLAFAEFLTQRGEVPDEGSEQPQSLEPIPIPRPEGESVVGAIKRLSESYHMIEKSALLTETTSLMTQHIMQGRGAEEVIDDLEALFRRYHQEHVEQHKSHSQ